MWRAYYPDDPITKGLGLVGKYRNTVLDEAVQKTLCEGVTLVAKCKYDGCIVGAAINGSTTPWDADLMDKLACTVSCPKTRTLFHMYAHVHRAAEVYKKFCTNKVFEVSICVKCSTSKLV